MGIWDIVKNAASAVGSAIANPISTAGAVLSAPVKLLHRIELAGSQLDEMPAPIKRLVDSPDGQLPIEEIVVFREPVNVAVRMSASLLTGGSMMNIRHVYEVFVLKSEDAKEYIRIEKNEVVTYNNLSETEFQALKKQNQHAVVQSAELNKLTLKQFFENYSSKCDPKVLWLYDPATANCQVFVYLGLKANNIAVPKTLEDFIVQKEVKHQIGAISGTIMKGITTLANFSRHLVGVGASGQFLLQTHGYIDREFNTLLAIEEAELYKLLNEHAELCVTFIHDLSDSGKRRKRGREEGLE